MLKARLRGLVHAYIRHPTCLVLAVSAANVDLANSDALAMAREVDPQGARTIGGSSPLCSTVQHCAVLCCAVLCCAVLCCAVLCCAVLCCAALRCIDCGD